MSKLTIIVPSRGRPHTVFEMAEAFRDTCTAGPKAHLQTRCAFAVDASDPLVDEYRVNDFDCRARNYDPNRQLRTSCYVAPESRSMVEALNYAATKASQLRFPPMAIGFMGDDHRPRTVGWDQAYLDALAVKPGIVYGNDLIQGERLPTQCAMSTGLVRALGNMAPPVLTHLYLDNYWLTLGREADCITYLPDVVVEHLHPVAGKAEWDEGYARVNDQSMYERDRVAFETYWAEHGERDVAVARAAVGARA